jgi:hypothetical protein
MKVIVAGGREFDNQLQMIGTLGRLAEDGWLDEHATLVCGMARGADRMAYNLWRHMSLPIEEHPADWDRHGKAAGYIRNSQMGQAAD